MSDETETERVLIVEAALSRWTAGDDKSFCEGFNQETGFVDIGKDRADEVANLPFATYKEAGKFVDAHEEEVAWVHDHIEDILRDALYKHQKEEVSRT